MISADFTKSHGGEVTTHVIAGVMKYAENTQDVFLLCDGYTIGMPCGKHALTKTGETDIVSAELYRKKYLHKFTDTL